MSAFVLSFFIRDNIFYDKQREFGKGRLCSDEIFIIKLIKQLKSSTTKHIRRFIKDLRTFEEKSTVENLTQERLHPTDTKNNKQLII